MSIIQRALKTVERFPVVIASGIQCLAERVGLGQGQLSHQATGNQYCGANHLCLHVSRSYEQISFRFYRQGVAPEVWIM